MKDLTTRSIAVITILLATPLLAAAQSNGLTELFIKLTDSLELLIPIIIGFGLLCFIWGIAMYVFHNGDTAKREEALKIITYGVFALLVMIGVWGFVEMLNGVFLSVGQAPNP